MVEWHHTGTSMLASGRKNFAGRGVARLHTRMSSSDADRPILCIYTYIYIYIYIISILTPHLATYLFTVFSLEPPRFTRHPAVLVLSHFSSTTLTHFGQACRATRTDPPSQCLPIPHHPLWRHTSTTTASSSSVTHPGQITVLQPNSL